MSVRIEKTGGRKPIVSGSGGAWVGDGYNSELKEKEYRIGFRGDDGKLYEVIVDELSSYDIAAKLAEYHSAAFRYARKQKEEQKTRETKP